MAKNRGATIAHKITIDTSGYLPHQKAFVTDTGRGQQGSKIAIVGGLGSGKTHPFLRKTLYHHLSSFNTQGEMQGYSNGGILYPNYSMAKLLFMRPITMMLSRYGIKNKANYSEMLIESNYGLINIMTMERPEAIIGYDWGYCGFDEIELARLQRAKDCWERAQGRMRGRPDWQMYAVTSPEGYGLMYELETSGEVKVIHAKTSDNIYLPISYMENMRNTYDELLLKQYFNGEYVNLNGRQAYYAFNREKHIIKTVKPYEFKSRTLYIGIDFNVDNFSLVVSEMVNGVLFVGREHRFKNFFTRDAVKFVQEMYGDYQIIICPDMTGGARKTSAEFTDLVLLRQGLTKHGQFRIIGDVNPTHRDRINTVNNSLDKIKVMIHPDCVILISDLEKVVTDAYGFIDKSQETQGLVHMSDAFGYTIINLFPLSKREYTRVG